MVAHTNNQDGNAMASDVFVWAQRIAEFTARCEKYVGTESGGMDQAISIMGEKGLAKLVHFKPVRLLDTHSGLQQHRHQFHHHGNSQRSLLDSRIAVLLLHATFSFPRVLSTS